jgi:Zn-dependent peptidase ImmA (M78 family)
LALTKEGDSVLIKFINSEQIAVPTILFRNMTLNLTSSENEKSVTQQMNKREEKKQTELDVKDFKEKVKSMSDDELKKLMDSKKEEKKK